MYRYKNKTVEEYRKEYYKTYPVEQRLCNSAKYRAKRDGLPFEITKEDIVIPEKCPYLGIQIVVGKGRASANSPSVDKIRPELGYVKGNIEVISNMANTMKQNASPKQLVTFAKSILEKFDLSESE